MNELIYVGYFDNGEMQSTFMSVNYELVSNRMNGLKKKNPTAKVYIATYTLSNNTLIDLEE